MNAALDGFNPADEAGRRALGEAERFCTAGIGAARLAMALPPADPYPGRWSSQRLFMLAPLGSVLLAAKPEFPKPSFP